jgi:hypothetical protein
VQKGSTMKSPAPTLLLVGTVLLIAASCGGESEQAVEEPTPEVSTTQDLSTTSVSEAEPDDSAADEASSDTTPEAPEAEAAPGSDPKGDPLDGLDNPTEEGAVAGGDIASVRHVLDESGDNCFVIDFYGDAEATAAEVGTYMVDVEVDDSKGGGFGVRTEFSRGEAANGSVRLGPLGPGRDKLEGAAVTLAWDDSDTLRTCIDGGDTTLDVATFMVSMYIFSADGDYWDRAEGIGAP